MSLSNLIIFFVFFVLGTFATNYTYTLGSISFTAWSVRLTQVNGVNLTSVSYSNPNISCQLGDIITFRPTNDTWYQGPGVNRHPFAVTYPNYTNITFGSCTSPNYPICNDIGGFYTLPCDQNMVNAGGVLKYVCERHIAAGMWSYVGINIPTNNVLPPLPAIPTLQNSVILDCSMLFSWTLLNSTQLQFSITNPTAGWSAIGFRRSDDAQIRGSFEMVGTDAIIGFAVTTPIFSGSVAGYHLYNQNLDASGIVAMNLGLRNISVQEINGVTTFSAIRDLTRGMNPYDPAIDNYAHLVVASSTTDDLVIHSCRSKYLMNCDLVNGDCFAVTNLRIAHTVLMGLSYAIIFPLGMIISRYKRILGLQKRALGTAIWFRLHQIIQAFGGILVIIGFTIGLSMVKFHFNRGLWPEPWPVSWHAIMGIIIFILTFLHFFVALLRPPVRGGILGGFSEPKSGSTWEEKTFQRKAFDFFHHWNGRLILILSIPQIIDGIRLITTQHTGQFWAYAIWGPFVVGWLLIFIVLEILTTVLFRKEMSASDVGRLFL